MPSNGSAYHSLWTDFSFRVAHRWEQPSLMKGHTLRPAQGSYACLTMERSYVGSTKHPHAINVCDFTRISVGLALAPLRRAPAVLAGSGKVLRVWAEARKVMRVRPQSIVSI